MRNFLLMLTCILLLTGAGFAQQSGGPKMVKKAKYFDKTPPLRDMKIVMPGERKRAWKDGIIKNESVELLGNGANTVNEDITYSNLQEAKGAVQSRGPLYSFDGVGNVNGVYPPDTDGDVGPNHYFQMINLSFAIWDKSGNKLYGPVDNSTLWAGFIGPWTGHNDGDPIVLYDEIADRWIASQFALNTSSGKFYQLVAVSVTGDPLDDYYRYAFEFDDMNDYPKMGVWPDGYYTTFNFFGNEFLGAGVAAFERDKMLIGDPDAQMIFFGYFANKYSLQPSDVDGENLPPAGSPNYVATVNAFGSKQFEIYEFKVDWETPANSTYQLGVTISPGSFNNNFNNGITQPNGSGLDALSGMLMYRLAYRNFGTHETMVANHTVNVSGRAGIKWYEFRKENGSEWFTYQQGVYAPNDGISRWMGSIAINAYGTIALGFSVTNSSTVFPSVRYTGRPVTAPLGEMAYEEIEVVTGTSSQSGVSRWGDYSNLSVDPVDDSTFWFTTEYMRGGWRTRIASFNFAPTLPPQVNAGDDGTVCQNTLFTTSGNVVSAKSWIWSTSGDGIFSTPGNLVTYYLGGQQDNANGQVTLTLSATGYLPGMQSSDDLILNFIKNPVINAGNDTTINSFTVLNTQAEGMNYESVAWTTDGDGSFTDTTALETIYEPGIFDIANEGVKLTLMAQPLDPCITVKTDDVNVTLNPIVGLNEQNDKIQLSVIPNPTGGEFMVRVNSDENELVLHILNASGETIFTEKASKTQREFSKGFDFQFLPKGIYFVKIESGQLSKTEKVVIK